MGKFIDIIGQRFGKNIVLQRIKGTDKKHVYWLVRCDCGKERKVDGYQIKKHNTGCTSCSHKMPNIKKRKRPHEWQYNSFVNRASVPVSITYEEFLSLAKIKNCHYCDSKIIWNEYRTWEKNGYCPGGSNLDRMDNTKFYDINNVVVCCGRCNYSKGNRFTYEEWLEIGNTIKGFTRKKGLYDNWVRGNGETKRVICDSMLENNAIDDRPNTK